MVESVSNDMATVLIPKENVNGEHDDEHEEDEMRDRLNYLLSSRLSSVDDDIDSIDETEDSVKIFSPSAFWSVENGHQEDTWNDIICDSEDDSESDSCSSHSRLRVNTLLLTINDDNDNAENKRDNEDISYAKCLEDREFFPVSAMACMKDRLRQGMKRFRAFNTPYKEPSVLFQHHEGGNNDISKDISDDDLASLVGISSFPFQLPHKLPQQHQFAAELCDRLESYTRVLVQQGDWLQALSVSARLVLAFEKSVASVTHHMVDNIDGGGGGLVDNMNNSNNSNINSNHPGVFRDKISATATTTTTTTTKTPFSGLHQHPSGLEPEPSYKRLPQLHVFLGHLVKRYVAVAVCHHSSLRMSQSNLQSNPQSNLPLSPHRLSQIVPTTSPFKLSPMQGDEGGIVDLCGDNNNGDNNNGGNINGGDRSKGRTDRDEWVDLDHNKEWRCHFALVAKVRFLFESNPPSFLSNLISLQENLRPNFLSNLHSNASSHFFVTKHA